MNSIFTLVTIIIPTYNRAKLIGETLDSVLAQTYTNWECIVVDDGSSDATEERVMHYVNKDSRFQFLIRPDSRKKGSAASRNIGFEASKGDFIQWLDSDDLLLPNAIETYLKHFTTGYDTVIGKVTQTDLLTGIKLKTNGFNYSHLIEDYFGGKITFYVCGPMWRRTFLEKQIALFDEELSILIDWDFNLSMLYAKPNIYFLEKSLIFYRQHNFSLKTNIKRLHPEKLEAAFKIRYKHFDILIENSLARKEVIITHIRDLHLQIVRYSIQEMSPNIGKHHFKKVLEHDLKLFNFVHFIRVFIGYYSFLLFGKGYRFLK